MEERWTVEKLEGELNWGTWKFQMRHLLLAKNLCRFVDGSEVLHVDATDAVRTEFTLKVQRAFSTIVMAIGTSQLYLVTSCTNAKDAWELLCEHFEGKTLTNKLRLKKQYFCCEMKEGTPVELHLKQMKEVTDKLAAIGAPVSEEDQVVTLLGSLPSSYSALVTTLECSEGVKLSYVQQALLHEERKKAKSLVDGTHEDQSTSALVGTQRKSRKIVRCYGCGEIGHIRRFCKQSKSRAGQNYGYKAKVAEESYSDMDEAFAASVGSLQNSSRWLVDSGASSHMTRQKEMLVDYIDFKNPQKVALGDGKTVEAVGKGNVSLQMLFKEDDPKSTVLYGVLYVPKLACSLFSVRSAAAKGNSVIFGKSECWIQNADGQLNGIGSLKETLYQLNCRPLHFEYASSALEKQCEADLWHQRFRHINEQQLQEIARKEMVNGAKMPTKLKLNFCQDCVEGKMHRLPFKSVGEIRSSRRLELVHSDVCGPMPTESIGGCKYFVTFIDDYSRCCSVYFMKHKSEVLDKFKIFESETTAGGTLKIGTLRSDNGGEYVSSDFKTYLQDNKVHHELTVPYSPEQNGVAERMNRTLVESACTMLLHAGLPDSYWAEAIATAAYIRNRMPTKSFKQSVTPYERWYMRKPNVSHFRVFGCIAYVHISDQARQKLDKKAVKLCFVGYSKASKGYRLIFNEDNFRWSKSEIPVRASEVLQTNSDESSSNSNCTENSEIEPRRSCRTRHPVVRYGVDEFCDTATQENKSCHIAFYASEVEEPTTIEEALSNPHATEWKYATDAEFKSLTDNETWDLVEPPPDKNIVGSKWVFKEKYKSDGKVDRFKARLVAKGYSQKSGVDYFETFSPVVRFTSIRALLAYAVQNNMLIHQMDVITAFLNGTLKEEIYMAQPEGYVEPGNEHLVCQLKKSIYGLKQSPRCWNQALSEYLESMGFTQSNTDSCVYIKRNNGISIIAVYVDDLAILATTETDMNSIKTCLAIHFKMKDLGELHSCLGVCIEWDNDHNTLWLHQKHFILNLIQKYGLQDANTTTTPADTSVKLTSEDGVSKTVDPTVYQSIVGSLMYTVTATRPDISFAVGVLSRFCSKPTTAHLTAAKRALRYLKGTSNLALKYCKSVGGGLTGYSDADWAGDVDDRHSTSGNMFIMAGATVSWTSNKQVTVSLSTTEAEYIALSTATQEVIWLQRLITELSDKQHKPTIIMGDNQGSITIARNPVFHARTKHIDIKYHFIREALQDGIINLQYCPTDEMIADVLTKPLSRNRFEKLRCLMGMDFLPTVN